MVAVTLYLCGGRLDRPLAAFPSTIFDVFETATVASVLQEAGADQFNTFQLVTDDLRADVTPRIENDECFGTAINLAGVGEDGRFQYSGPDTTVGDLRRACERGIFGGDPRTWIVHRESGAAGSGPPNTAVPIPRMRPCPLSTTAANATIKTATAQQYQLGMTANRMTCSCRWSISVSARAASRL